ncbi:MAG: MarR family winged helix-turn-helix transcriptional regulator [Fidelibacterota bacterium]
MELGELLKELTLVLNALHRRDVCGQGRTLSQCFVLMSLPYDGLDMSALSRKLGLDNSTTTRLVDTLEKHGWVERKRDRRDRRVMTAKLTQEGENVAKELDTSMESLGEAVLEYLSPEKRENTQEVLQELLWGLSKEKLKER